MTTRSPAPGQHEGGRRKEHDQEGQHVATVAAAQVNWAEYGVKITIQLTAEELQITSWAGTPRKLLEVWLAPGGTIRSDTALQHLELAVFRRRPYDYVQRSAGERPWAAEGAPGRRVALRADSAWEKLSYHLRRAWTGTTAVAAGADLVPELAETVRRLLPLLDRMNPGSRGSS